MPPAGDTAHIVHAVLAIPTGIFSLESAGVSDETAVEMMKEDMEKRFAEALALCKGVSTTLHVWAVW